MKKIVFGLVFAVVGFASKAQAIGQSGTFPQFDGYFMRSSWTNSCDQNVSVASGQIVLSGFTLISTATAQIGIYDTTSTIAPGNFATFIGSFSTLNPIPASNSFKPILLKKGFTPNTEKSGSCPTIIWFWDWISPAFANPRQ